MQTNSHLSFSRLLLNISRLDINDFVFIHAFFLLLFCSTVLYVFFVVFSFSDCVKGYYKRAKAHAAVWNEKEARRDFNMVAHLDITLASLVNREMKTLSERLKEKYSEEKEKYWNMLEKMENKNEEGEEGDDEEEEEVEDKGDSESATTERRDKVGEDKGKEESPSKCAEVHDEELGGSKGTSTEGTGNEISPNASNKTEGKDWQQMLRLVMLLQNEGNFLIKEKNFQEASVKFKEAIEYVDLLQSMVSVIDYIVTLCKRKTKVIM